MITPELTPAEAIRKGMKEYHLSALPAFLSGRNSFFVRVPPMFFDGGSAHWSLRGGVIAATPLGLIAAGIGYSDKNHPDELEEAVKGFLGDWDVPLGFSDLYTEICNRGRFNGREYPIVALLLWLDETEARRGYGENAETNEDEEDTENG